MMDEPGDRTDLNFIDRGDWLASSLVTTRVHEERGRWWVSLIYTAKDDALRKLVRTIDHYSTRRRAELAADILRRQIGADPRDPRPKQAPDADDIHPN